MAEQLEGSRATFGVVFGYVEARDQRNEEHGFDFYSFYAFKSLFLRLDSYLSHVCY